MPKASGSDESLKRLGGGRWQTRDERFTIEPQSGTWAVIDAETTDELGLALVRGPFGSLAAAKAAIEAARAGGPEGSPLAERAAALRSRVAAAGPTSPADAPTKRTVAKVTAQAKPVEPVEPAWITALGPDERRRARRLVARLEAADAPDPEGIARRDIGGDVAATAAFAIERALRALGPDAEPAAVAALLADGADRDLDVRWRLVDGQGRPITLDRRASRPE